MAKTKKEITQWGKKMAENLGRHFSKKGLQVAKKDPTRRSASLITREINARKTHKAMSGGIKLFLKKKKKLTSVDKGACEPPKAVRRIGQTRRRRTTSPAPC